VAEPKTGRWTAHLPPTARQWVATASLVVLSWGLLMGYAVSSVPGWRRPEYLWIGTAGFLLLVVTVGYVIFLRARSAPLEISPSAVTLLGRAVPRGPAELGPWSHLLHEGAVLTLPGPDGPLRLGTSHSLPAPAPALRALWSADARVDAILSPPDFSDVAAVLGAAHLGWKPRARGWRHGPIAAWLVTMACLCALGGLLAATGLGGKLVSSLPGLMFVQTICFGAVAVGITLTVARAPVGRTRRRLARHASPHAASAAPHARSPFLGGLVVAVVSAMAGATLFGTPILVITTAFERWVDVPGCQARCAAHDLPYTSFASTNTGTYCSCGDSSVFHDHTNVFGGDGFLAGLADWLVRATAIVAGFVGWFALVVSGLRLLSRVLARRET
jgi:hypothetical protein